METYKIKSQKELEKFKDEFGYYVKGNLEANCSLDIEKRLKVDGYLSIEAGESIKAGESIEAGWSIKAGGSIEAGWSIKAGGSIEAGEYYGISAGLSITCKESLSFGLKAFAGIKTWGEATEEDKTITCGKLVKGEVAYGILNETGLTSETKTGKKVKIRLAEGNIVEGEIID